MDCIVQGVAKSQTQLSNFHFTSLHKRLLSSSSVSAIRMVLSIYLRLLIFLLVILIPACGSSSLAFCMMYSACKLNKQGNTIQLCHTSFPILNQSLIPCLVLTVAFWPTYRRQASQETGKVVWYSHLFNNFPQLVMIHIVLGFSIVNEAK